VSGYQHERFEEEKADYLRYIGQRKTVSITSEAKMNEERIG